MEGHIYSAAAYLRLSRDDEDIDGSMKSESGSISSQRELIRAYIKEHGDIELFHTYVDDGYSGANFDRPGFKKMMADIKAGDVDCVIVKDLSRFGRDYIEAGRFIQKTFPAFHVRFIAVTDNFDSQMADQNTKSLVLPVKNFINDSYCRDISCKVKSHQKIKREQGKFIGAFAMYGYRKSAEDKNRLCPDGYAADIVRRIFMWKLEGMSAHAIACRLNGLGILSPMEYKKSHGEKFYTGFQTNVTAKWSAVAVKRILTDEVYTGAMVQGKKEQVNYKVRKMAQKPQAEWVRVEGTHEAVISREDFEMVQALLRVDTRANAGSACAHLFSGILFCGDCGGAMARRVNRYKGKSSISYICPTRNKSQGCTRHNMLENGLKTAVLQALRVNVQLFLDVQSQLAHARKMKIPFEEVARLNMEVERLRGEQDKYSRLLAGLYEDLKAGLLTESDFKNFQEIYTRQLHGTKEAIARQEGMLKQLFRNGIASGVKLEKLGEGMALTELSRDALLCFISRIEVFEGNKISIKFRCKDGFRGLSKNYPVKEGDV